MRFYPFYMINLHQICILSLYVLIILVSMTAFSYFHKNKIVEKLKNSYLERFKKI